jgi:Fe-S-cluster containining protein
MPTYECDKCGACCKGILIVETDDLDILREPRLIDADPHHRGKSVAQVVSEIRNEMKAVVIACGHSCSFLAADNRCTIYPTRPNVCVAFEAGDEQCQEARAAHGLPPLLPVV